MVAAVAQRERRNINCYTSAFSINFIDIDKWFPNRPFVLRYSTIEWPALKPCLYKRH